MGWKPAFGTTRWCLLALLAGAVCLAVGPPVRGADEVEERLNAAARKLFAEKRFPPRLIPQAPFKENEKDVWLLQAVWETVRPDLEELYRKELKLKKKPDLRLRFVASAASEMERVRTARVVFRDPENVRVRRSLISLLSLPPRSFDPFNLERTTVAAPFVVDVRPVKLKEVDLDKLEASLRELLTGEKGPFARLKLGPLQVSKPKGDKEVKLLSQWVFIDEDRETGDSFHWRYLLHLTKTSPKELKLEAGVELGRKQGNRPPEGLRLDAKEGGPDQLLHVRLERPDGPKPSRRVAQRMVHLLARRPGCKPNDSHLNPEEWTDYLDRTHSPIEKTARALAKACRDRIVKEIGWFANEDNLDGQEFSLVGRPK